MSQAADTPSPCMSCGACCAYFRVSFYWGEQQSAGGLVPDELTQKISPHLSCMQGTGSKPARCVALTGDIGQSVACSIYAQRSTTCREFAMSGENGEHNPECDKARAFHGLAPLVWRV
ncbi:MAG TPA: YkgJ family cysteine cluster protein [Cellvibrionaceae bacterium]|nr:YkgJ family cysteine cluster protein [Cellvibrionaceae bacterium]HMY38295.1 YkgJ family cysteine cluster protein [Marinagarivorans sp.]HNG58652.1 YkgJ family cysteine cluster protein [Cellvibrionaceae bacterium]